MARKTFNVSNEKVAAMLLSQASQGFFKKLALTSS
eukprot:CAMPEP_0195112468 /NCGR_PEP_ID=MMETSP0448-20130528/99206_1 /TAXON_ID=66468 /ORGANISM="Heterocapsa triquestra, Strain CCMP 448" /LENGTH=34 /DNA_ID= /DNA_START= /DNA_END= /DNA_ORIENTATION=